MLDNIVREAIDSAISGILSEQRAQARAKKITNLSFIVSVPLTDILPRAQSRIQGLNENLPLPTLEDIQSYLFKMGYQLENEHVELTVCLPPPRPAHAR